MDQVGWGEGVEGKALEGTEGPRGPVPPFANGVPSPLRPPRPQADAEEWNGQQPSALSTSTPAPSGTALEALGLSRHAYQFSGRGEGPGTSMQNKRL